MPGLFGGSSLLGPSRSSAKAPAAKPPSPSGDVDDTDEVDDGNRNIILSIIKQLRPGSDLSRITLPTFILERKSMLERITNLMQHPHMLIEANRTADDVDRFVTVLRWYMSGWHIAPKAVKKPLNPVLGEYFSCYWDIDGDGTRAYYIAEQTSHHPPKSAYFYTVPKYGVRADGMLLPHSRFLGNSAASMMEGVGYVTLTRPNGADERYQITQPNIYARGILTGNLKMELGDKASVVCEALDMRADIEFKCKGFISGTYNAISGTISRRGKVIFELSGKWNEVMELKSTATGRTAVLFDVAKDSPEAPLVRPISEQGQYESRRLWYEVVEALGKRNHTVATDKKFEIENAQRQLAKERADGQAPPYVPKLFKGTARPLEYKICVDEQLVQAGTNQLLAEQALQSVMPILPGAQFPADFDDSGEEKAYRARHPPGAPAQGQMSGTDDEFVDALDHLEVS